MPREPTQSDRTRLGASPTRSSVLRRGDRGDDSRSIGDRLSSGNLSAPDPLTCLAHPVHRCRHANFAHGGRRLSRRLQRPAGHAEEAPAAKRTVQGYPRALSGLGSRRGVLAESSLHAGPLLPSLRDLSCADLHRCSPKLRAVGKQGAVSEVSNVHARQLHQELQPAV